MTLLPHNNQDVKGIPKDEYPPYDISVLCCHPHCSKPATEGHHMWRRSFTIGPYDWVRLWDGTVVGNVVGLCMLHHNDITGNRSKIIMQEDFDADSTGWYFAYYQQASFQGPLKPQPRMFSPSLPDSPGTPRDLSREVQHDHDTPDDKATCPTCHQRVRPVIVNKREGVKARKSWTVTVPADRSEDGADVLDTLLESARMQMDAVGLSYGPERNVRYYILSTALGLFVQHFDQLAGDS